MARLYCKSVIVSNVIVITVIDIITVKCIYCNTEKVSTLL